MRPAFPIFAGVALAAMVSAGASHWWTVHTFVAAAASGAVSSGPAPTPPVPTPPVPAPPVPAPPASAAPDSLAAADSPAAHPVGDATAAAQKEFFDALIAEIRSLRGENRDLRDQMAETNRDLMKLEFRVDTHSESFRPLPVSESGMDTTFDEGPGVLPPRAEPVTLPSHE